MAAVFFYIIFNPAAGSGTSVATFKAVRKVLDERHYDYEIRVSRYAGHAVQLGHQISSFNTHKNAVVMVIGGDGTLNQTITGLRQSDQPALPVAYIPAGSGNDFARGIGLPQDPMKALDHVLAATQPVTLDIGRYTEQTRHESGYFVNNIGFGFDAAAVAAANRGSYKKLLNKLHLGSLAYMFGVVNVFFSRRPFPVTVHANGKYEHIPRAFLCTTTNHPYFGGGIRILPTATPTDGELDLIVVENLNIPYFLFLLLELIRGKHMKYKAVHHFKSDHLVVETNSLEFGQMDGEEMGTRAFQLDFSVTQQPFWLKLD
ncbi:diacylglycerol/lipid kinase family protein [Lacticaseibacillus daqingensis]|uniref:diacylglycerol/lipid kinase family protein n=1 Tax=Lacticaseibacillus daqingensis TaxID=2486014 RepID=UPI000F781D81|nr:diacylglycerol kinase family protein [Lacticaseibacillus daqingensis]